MANPKVIVRDDVPQRSEIVVDTRSELQKRVEARAASRSFNPKFRQGKGQIFDLDNYGCDYTAGGFLKGRFVSNNPSRISMMKAQGYEFPDTWDAELERVEFGGLTLMLQESAHAAEKRKQIEILSRQQEASAYVTRAVQEGKIDLNGDNLLKTEQKFETFHNKSSRAPVGPD